MAKTSIDCDFGLSPSLFPGHALYVFDANIASHSPSECNFSFVKLRPPLRLHLLNQILLI